MYLTFFFTILAQKTMVYSSMFLIVRLWATLEATFSFSLLRSRSVPLLISDVSHCHFEATLSCAASLCLSCRRVYSIERQESNQLLECTTAARINHWKSPVLSAAAHLARLQYYRWMICTLRRIQTTLAMIDSLNRGGSGKLHRYSNLCFPSVPSASRKS